MKMFKNKSMNLGLVSVGLLAMVPSFALADRTLQGVVTLTAPISQATIKVTDASGKLLTEKSQATSETGYFTVTVPTDQAEGLRVEATTSDGEHLYGGVPPGFDTNSGLIHLNAATTLVERYLDLNPASTQEAAEARVREFLEVPETLDFGPGIENPYLTVFSSGVLENEAQTGGGLDAYTQKLALEMSTSNGSTHSFSIPEGSQNGFEWIADKLAGGIVSAIGSQIFGELQNGIGIPDKQSQILDLVKQVMAQIANLQKSMDALEKKIDKAQYNIRGQQIWDEWGELGKLVAKVLDQNTQALANMKDGKVVSEDKAKEIAGNIKGYELEIIATADKFITHVNTRFVGDTDPLQQIYANFTLGQIVDQAYLKKIDGHVEKYRSQQTIAMALLVDTYRALHNESAATTALNVNKPLIEAVKLIYPTDRIFTLKDTLARVEKKQVVYDRNQDLLFELTYMHFTDTTSFLNYAKNRPSGKLMPTNREQTSRLLNAAGISGNFAEMAKTLGFAEKEANDTKMIVDWTYTEKRVVFRKTIVTTYFNWWGNDVDPRNRWYHDDKAQFDRVKADKKMGAGFFTMGSTPLKELSK